MVDGLNENIFLVNAPAGSGKTTWIRKEVEKHLLHNQTDNVLCITYTNRAAEELGKEMDGARAFYGTIHSFINAFIRSFFSHSAIIELYWEVYERQIVERIQNINQNSNWTRTNEKYIEKYGRLDIDTVRTNIKEIFYNETPFNSLYRGGLGHDDLVAFTRLAVDRFPVIKKKISDKYQLIFVDEYQDTAADVLHIFYESVKGKKSKLYFLGDKMQQIYRNYNGEFESQFATMNRTLRLSINYRTTPKIVSILNHIYNDPSLNQEPYEKNTNDCMAFLPKVIITTDQEKAIADITTTYEDALVLYLSNKERFSAIHAEELYEAYSKMEKYGFYAKYNVADVLTKEDARDNDALLSILFLVDQIVTSYSQDRIGEIFRCIRKKSAYCNYTMYSIRTHSDKSTIKRKLDRIARVYKNEATTIHELLGVCVEESLVKEEIKNNIEADPDYPLAKEVSVQNIRNLVTYLNNPKVSTQHGVKGESHDTVVFVADNSNNPPVSMKKFFELWSNINITLSEFDAFYYRFRNMIARVEETIGMKCSDLKAASFSIHSRAIDAELEDFAAENGTSPYYLRLLYGKFKKYFEKKNVSNVKDCLKDTTVYSALCAYRLFYVGCSRARKNLIVLINRSHISAFEGLLTEKLESCGFEVEYK